MSDVSQQEEKRTLSVAERKAAQRARDRANGMVEITVKVPHDRVEDARAWCGKLKAKRPKSAAAADPLPDLFDPAP